MDHLKTVLFDLDGTLLPMDQEHFVKTYFKLLAARLAPLGYEPGKLVDSIWTGTAAMVKNDGSRTNEEAFWETFTALCGDRVKRDRAVIEDFYAHEFNQAQAVCGFNPAAAETVNRLKAAGVEVVLATNPIFPRTATQNRIRWAGLDPEDFQLFTTYENAHFCKPNPDYYREILKTIGRRPEECLMVGNDATEDGAAEQAGIPVFLLTDCLIAPESADLSRFPQGGFPELNAYLKLT